MATPLEYFHSSLTSSLAQALTPPPQVIYCQTQQNLFHGLRETQISDR